MSAILGAAPKLGGHKSHASHGGESNRTSTTPVSPTKTKPWRGAGSGNHAAACDDGRTSVAANPYEEQRSVDRRIPKPGQLVPDGNMKG